MPELACKIDGCDYSGSPQGLRSHLHGRKDDDHVDAAGDRLHHDWYPIAYGLDDEGTDDDRGDNPDATPSNDPPERASEEGSERGSDGEADDTLESTPSEGGSESPDPDDEYADQWEAVATQDEGPSEGGSEEGSEEDSDGDGDDTPDATPSEGGSDGGSGGLGTALMLGTGALAVAVLLRGGGSDPTESPDATKDEDTQIEGGEEGGETPNMTPSEGGWGEMYVESLAVLLPEVAAEMRDGEDADAMTSEEVAALATEPPVELDQKFDAVVADMGMQEMSDKQALLLSTAIVCGTVLLKDSDVAGDIVAKASNGVSA